MMKIVAKSVLVVLLVGGMAMPVLAQGGRGGGNRQGGRGMAGDNGVGAAAGGPGANAGGAGGAGQGNCMPMQNANAGELATVAQSMMVNFDADGNGALDMGELQRALGGLQSMMMQNQGNRMAMAAGNGMMDPNVVMNERGSRNQRMMNAGGANAGGANAAPMRGNGGRSGGRK